MDKIIIKGLRVFAYHGVNPEEQVNGQTFELDVEVYVSLRKAGQTDCVEDTVSYAKVTKTIHRAMTEKPFQLLEAAAKHVIQQIVEEYPRVDGVNLLLKKPEAPIKAEFDYMGVEIFRSRSDFYV